MQNYKLKLKNYLKSIPLSAGYQSFSFFIFHFKFQQRKTGFTPYINFDRFFGCRESAGGIRQNDAPKVLLRSHGNGSGSRSCITGFTLLETVVALGVILSALVGPVSLITSGLSDFASAKHKIIAANLAQEGIELARAIREANVTCDMLNGPPVWPWNVDPDRSEEPPGQREFYDTEVEVAAQGIDTDTTLITCGGIVVNGNPVSISVPRIPLSTRRTLKLDANGFYGYSGQNTNFIRYVHIVTSRDSSDRDSDRIQDNEEMDIISTVTWNERGTEKTLTLRERLYNWR